MEAKLISATIRNVVLKLWKFHIIAGKVGNGSHTQLLMDQSAALWVPLTTQPQGGKGPGSSLMTYEAEEARNHKVTKSYIDFPVLYK